MGGAPWGGTPGVPQARPGASQAHRVRAPSQMCWVLLCFFTSLLTGSSDLLHCAPLFLTWRGVLYLASLHSTSLYFALLDLT